MNASRSTRSARRRSSTRSTVDSGRRRRRRRRRRVGRDSSSSPQSSPTGSTRPCSRPSPTAATSLARSASFGTSPPIQRAASPPAVHHFVPLFHAFAHHGVAPFGAGARAYDVNPTTLRGTHLRAYAVRRDASPACGAHSDADADAAGRRRRRRDRLEQRRQRGWGDEPFHARRALFPPLDVPVPPRAVLRVAPGPPLQRRAHRPLVKGPVVGPLCVRQAFRRGQRARRRRV